MGKKSRPKKVPKFAPENRPQESKTPKVAIGVDSGPSKPVWRFSHLDWDGPWCPSKCKEAGVRGLIERLGAFESMSWIEIKSSGSHTVGAEGIIKQARDRLTERKLDEWADHLTSLRITGKARLWGFLRAEVFHALWWDPEHQVYPSPKKHT